MREGPHCELSLAITSTTPGAGQQKAKVPETCHCLLTVYKIQLLKEPYMVQELCEAGSQGVTRVSQVVFTR